MNHTFKYLNPYNFRQLRDCIEHVQGRKIAIWGTRKKGEEALQILNSLAGSKMVSCFVSSNPISSSCYGLPLYTPEILNVSEYYVVVTTTASEVRQQLLSKKFFDEKSKDFVTLNLWHDDMEYHGCYVGRGTYGYETLCSKPGYGFLIKRIGRYCSINESAKVVFNHPMGFVTTNPILYNKAYGPQEMIRELMQLELSTDEVDEVDIGNDVWIGANVVILPGVKIGDGAILAAGAIINKDVKPYEVVGGVPAKTLKYRFPPNIVESFTRIKWWDWPLETIAERFKLFYNPEMFCRTFDPDFVSNR